MPRFASFGDRILIFSFCLFGTRGMDDTWLHLIKVPMITCACKNFSMKVVVKTPWMSMHAHKLLSTVDAL